MKIIFLGSPEFSVPTLELLHASHEVVAVVTQPDRPSGRNLKEKAPAIKIAAHRLRIPVFQPQTTKAAGFYEEMSSFKADVLVVVAYGEILRKNILQLAPLGAINLHASLLPRYRGAAPIAWSILHGDTETGATTMLMDEAMDAGPILLQETCPILPTDTTETLSKKISRLGAPLMKRTLELYSTGQLQPQIQDLTQITYAPKLKKEDGWVDWSRPADWIARQIRAFDPWPGTYAYFRDKRIKLWLAHSVGEKTDSNPGTILEVARSAIAVACGNRTILHILELQPETRPRITAFDFINGYHVKRGDRFGGQP